MDHIWRASQWALQTDRGNYTVHSIFGDSHFTVIRSWSTEAGESCTEWLGGVVDGIPHIYVTLVAAQEAVGADLAHRDAMQLEAAQLAVDRRLEELDAGVDAVCSRGSEQLEACRGEVTL